MTVNANAEKLLLWPTWNGEIIRLKLLWLIILVVASLGLSACGLQSDTITISYMSEGNAQVLSGANGTVVDVEVVDLRSNKSEVSKKGDEYEFLAPILVENDVGQVLRAAIETELRNRGFDVGEGGVVVLAELSKFYNRFRASNSEAEVFIHVQVKKATGDLIYSEIIEGKGINPDVGLRSGANAKIALETAMRDAVSKLMSNIEFLDSLIKAGQG